MINVRHECGIGISGEVLIEEWDQEYDKLIECSCNAWTYLGNDELPVIIYGWTITEVNR